MKVQGDTIHFQIDGYPSWIIRKNVKNIAHGNN